eukprot:Nitzschia sp. Nitz4//scaffold9_size221794//146107//147480//NITZ4_001366-RA/size221794-snap-gene-0.189-mRNA-1//-1//CDS//3329561061//1041//frame0
MTEPFLVLRKILLPTNRNGQSHTVRSSVTTSGLQRHCSSCWERTIQQQVLSSSLYDSLYCASSAPLTTDIMVNKMFIMLPVMFAARKLDGEDPQQVFLLRVAYGLVQFLSLLVVLYTYMQASKVSKSGVGTTIYVPPPAQPFADPNAKKKYTEVQFGAHVSSTAWSLLGTSLMGVVMTVGLHLYKGMIVGLAIQTIMGPLNLVESPLVKAVLLGKGIRPEDKIFEEKAPNELEPDDEIVDQQGNTIVRQAGTATPKLTTPASFEELLLDTWDAGNNADIGTLLEAITKKNCNYRTKESGWTPLMILSGLNAKGTVSAIRQVKELGGNPAVVDAEGWNSLHWAAFHGSINAAEELLKDAALLSVKDKEGKIPVDLAKAEKNDDVAKLLEASMGDSAAKTSDAGLRKRK